jgi:hypothetical protein
MKSSKLKYLLTGAALVLAMGCGSSGGSDSGNDCTSDANCGTGRVCHPILKVCLSGCVSGSDCSSDDAKIGQKTCAKIDGTAGTSAAQGFCQCSTDALCGTGNVCSALTKRCTAKCATKSDCPGTATCNATTGQCAAGASVDAGMTGDAGVACSSAKDAPDTCGYGGVCNTAMSCQAVKNDVTCTNISSSNFTPWPAGMPGTGPVIYSHRIEAGDNTKCDQATANKNGFTLTLFVYAGANYTFPDQKSALPGFAYYSSTGASTAGNSLLQQINYTLSNGSKNMTAKFTLCASSTSPFTAGFAFTNGNAYCTEVSR